MTISFPYLDFSSLPLPQLILFILSILLCQLMDAIGTYEHPQRFHYQNGDTHPRLDSPLLTYLYLDIVFLCPFSGLHRGVVIIVRQG